MITVTLPDGAQRHYDTPPSGQDIADSISKSLGKSAIALVVNDQQRDLSYRIQDDASVKILTKKDTEALELLRHDAAHLMAQAVKELYPETQVTIGPAIENGFYYDFHRGTSFSSEDLAKIEARMRELVDENIPIVREEWVRDEAVRFFKDMGEEFKAEIIASIPNNEVISLYRQGGFIDLCRGPHLPSTGRLGKAFKIMKLAGAYWRGDANNVMLQRIYGTAWATQEQLEAYLHQIEEAEKRDHRKLGRNLGLFHMQEEAAGSVFWHPKGWRLYQQIKAYLRKKLDQQGYQEVNTPILVDRQFWERSGHWDKFRDAMFTTADADGGTKTLAMKPMNCPCHVQIFNQGIKSYRDLPMRLSEFGCCSRNEPSGALHGLMRVRAFVQDDAHIFCTRDQVSAETQKFCTLLQEVYRDFGFEEVRVKLSDRPEVRAGSDSIWGQAEAALAEATQAAGLDYTLNPGEGAFYGPKLEFILKDAIGREWQCGTIQLDFVLPERLGATYIGADGQKHIPVMLHRAILGSFERFIGILIENYAGNFPLWLAPTQAVVIPVSQDNNDTASRIAQLLEEAGIRCDQDLRNEKLNYKIREQSHAKVPLHIIVGQEEAANGTVTIRYHGRREQETLVLRDAIAKIKGMASVPV